MTPVKNLLWQFILPTLLCSSLTQIPVQASPNIDSGLASRNSNYVQDLVADGYYNWGPEKFPLKVHFEKNVNVPGFSMSNINLLKTCFDDWTRASNGKLSWVETRNAADADINVTWSDDAVEGKRGTEAGKTRNYARYNPETNWGVIDRSQMRLLTRLPEREFSSIEMRKAYLHEVGHALGIAGHSSDPDDIMYFSVSNHNRVNLSRSDIGTLNYLYQQPGFAVTTSDTSNHMYKDHSSTITARR